MRKILFVIVCVISGMIMNAQINIHRSDTIPTKEEEIARYDSTDVDIWHKPERFIGQKVITFQKGSPIFIKDYREIGGQRVLNVPLFTYFEIVGIERQEVKMKNIETGEICYYFHTGDGVKPIMAVGYIERIMRNYMNSLWCIDDKDGLYKIIDIWLAEGGMRYKLSSLDHEDEFELKTLYGCKSIEPFYEYIEKYKEERWILDGDFHIGSVDRIEVRKGQPHLVFKDDSQTYHSFYLHNPIKPNEYFPDGLHYGNLPKYKEVDHKKYLKQFGKIYWVNILNGTVCLNMTQEMVRLAYGNPPEVFTEKDSSGIIDIWKYANKHITFINGKVTHITDFN